MRLFALSDPHLSFDGQGNAYKPMDIFGDGWQNHSSRIQTQWLEQVQADDVVLLPGDISWAMTLDEVQPDLEFLAALPGYKIISKGNHDLWWDSLTKVQKILPDGFAILQNNSFVFGDTVICGTRGWQCPDGVFADAHDEKIFRRELGRLKLSLDSAPKTAARKIVMLHYPPVNGRQEKSEFVELMEQYHVDICLYGHLHSHAVRTALEGVHWGMEFQLVSADYLSFQPKLILQNL